MAMVALLVSSTSIITAQAASGDLDPSFDADGIVTTDVSNNVDIANAVAIQSDGRIVVAGDVDGSDGFAVARYNPDGSLDTSFGAGGIVRTDFNNNTEEARAIVIQSDEKIVAGGVDFNGSNSDFALARYNSDGSLDATFGVGGKITTDFFSSVDEINALAIQSDGRIVAAGSVNDSGEDIFGLARYNTDGSLDTSFGTDGKVTTDFTEGSADTINAIAIQNDGRIVAVGSTDNFTNSNLDFAVARYNADGTLDATFGAGGRLVQVLSDDIDEAKAVAPLSGGKMLVAGTGADTFALVRYNADGSLDTSFGTGGVVTTSFGNDDNANAMIVQADGKIVLGGTALGVGATSADFAVARYLSDGSLDPAFGNGGKVTTSIGDFDEARALAIQSDGNIIAVGFADLNTEDFALARYLNDVQCSLACPSNVAAVENPRGSGTSVVNYPPPVVMGLCQAVCSPPSGSSFPLGITTVTCTTIGIGAGASCSFTVTVIPAFDICMQDNSKPANKLLFLSTTGDYIFCLADGSKFTGRGTVSRKGSTVTLTHNSATHRVQATVTLGGVNKGTASLQSPPGIAKATITDSNTTNNNCVCSN